MKTPLMRDGKHSTCGVLDVNHGVHVPQSLRSDHLPFCKPRLQALAHSVRRRSLFHLFAIAVFSVSFDDSQARELNNSSAMALSQAAPLYPYNMVEVRRVIPDIQINLRYGHENNVGKRAYYPPGMPCLLHDATAQKLAKAQSELKSKGFQLLIWDAWRPCEVQSQLFEEHRASKLFANPNIGWSFHCLGTAVDVTLLDAKGQEVKMPSDFDEPDPMVAAWMLKSFPEVRSNLNILKKAMHRAGFTSISKEWWHFEDSELKAAKRPKAIPARALGVRLPQ